MFAGSVKKIDGHRTHRAPEFDDARFRKNIAQTRREKQS